MNEIILFSICTHIENFLSLLIAMLMKFKRPAIGKIRIEIEIPIHRWSLFRTYAEWKMLFSFQVMNVWFSFSTNTVSSPYYLETCLLSESVSSNRLFTWSTRYPFLLRIFGFLYTHFHRVNKVQFFGHEICRAPSMWIRWAWVIEHRMSSFYSQ